MKPGLRAAAGVRPVATVGNRLRKRIRGLYSRYNRRPLLRFTPVRFPAVHQQMVFGFKELWVMESLLLRLLSIRDLKANLNTPKMWIAKLALSGPLRGRLSGALTKSTETDQRPPAKPS